MGKYSLITKIRRINPYKSIMKKSQEHRTFDNKLNRQFVQTVPRICEILQSREKPMEIEKDDPC